jgi:hypothetical protein
MVIGPSSTAVVRENQYSCDTRQNKNSTADGLQVCAAKSVNVSPFLWYGGLITVTAMSLLLRMYKISEPSSVW